MLYPLHSSAFLLNLKEKRLCSQFVQLLFSFCSLGGGRGPPGGIALVYIHSATHGIFRKSTTPPLTKSVYLYITIRTTQKYVKELNMEGYTEEGVKRWHEAYRKTMELVPQLRAEQEAKRNSITSKKCSSCNEELPIQYFSIRNKKRKDGSFYKTTRSQCKRCRNVKNKQYRDSPEGKAIVNAYKAKP